VSKSNTIDAKDTRRHLVIQVASSTYFAKSARLREMFIYVCGRVLDHNADEIHEQEVGRQVFGRPPDYDTSADNTVRVHASMLRKRVDQYFAKEGLSEPLVIEIPRGNYAPVFRERPVVVKLAEPDPHSPFGDASTPAVASVPKSNWAVGLSLALAALFAAISLALFLHIRHAEMPNTWKDQPTVRQFWSQVFQKNRPTDLVLGDAALALFEERTDHPVALAEYFDRSYLNTVGDRASAAKLDPSLAKTLLLKRQSSYSDVALLAQMTDMARSLQSDTKVRFARDYSFRELKTDNAVLLGNTGSNPWIEPFENHQTLHWKFDTTQGLYYPVDTTAAASDQQKYNATAQPDQPHEGYAILSFFPNMGGTGNVLTISGTGGSAMNGALSFLADEHLISQLRAQLNPGNPGDFPYFEALLKIGSRNTLPRDASIVIARRLHP